MIYFREPANLNWTEIESNPTTGKAWMRIKNDKSSKNSKSKEEKKSFKMNLKNRKINSLLSKCKPKEKPSFWTIGQKIEDWKMSEKESINITSLKPTKWKEKPTMRLTTSTPIRMKDDKLADFWQMILWFWIVLF